MTSESIDIINAFALLTNFVILPALSYGSQLALGALAVTLVYYILCFFMRPRLYASDTL